jgi:hypothetical protein
MRTLLNILLLLCLSTSVITAQSYSQEAVDGSESRIAGYSMSLGFGTSIIQPGGFNLLNQHLQQHGYATIPTQLTNWNWDIIHAIYNKAVFQMSVGGIFKLNSVNDSSRTRFTETSFNIGLGRVLYYSKKSILYPMLKAGWGGANLHSHFSGLNTSGDVSATNGHGYLDISLNLDYLFKGFNNDKVNWNSSKPDIAGTCVLSLTVGYTFCPVKTYWNDADFELSSRFNKNVNYPTNVIGSLTTSNFSMFYATLKIGLGAFAKKQKFTS